MKKTAKGTLRDWVSAPEPASGHKGSNRKNKVWHSGKLYSKTTVDFKDFGSEDDAAPIENENQWGEKIGGLQCGIINENNVLYFDSGWVDPDKHDDVDSVEVEFWFKCERGRGETDQLQVLFMSSKEEIMVGVRKSRLFVKARNKSRRR